MKKLPNPRECGNDPSCPVNFLLLHDGEKSARRALALLQKLLRYFDSGFHHNVRVWQDTRMEEPSTWGAILEDLRSANILIIAADRNTELLAMIVGAAESAPSHGALVALVDDTKNHSVGTALDRFAQDGGFHWREWESSESP